MPSGLRTALAILALTAPYASAQELPTLQRRVDSLLAVAEGARLAVEAFDDSVRRSRPGVDSAIVGPAIVAFEPELTEMMRQALGPVTEKLRLRFGDLRVSAPCMRYVVRPYEPDQWERQRRLTPTVTLSETTPAGREIASWRNPRDPSAVEDALLAAITGRLLMNRAPDVAAWIGGHAPTDSVTSSEWAEHRMLLISSPTSVGARCHAGELVACKAALLLTPVNDPVMDWHDATTRRRLVISARGATERTSARAVGECEAGSDSACVWVLQHAPPGVVAEPVHSALRLSVARFAIAMGGDGALQRYVAASPGIEQRLSAAANVPFDSVLSQWNQRIRNTRLPSHNLGPGIIMATVLWVGGLGALSLRSSRWR